VDDALKQVAILENKYVGLKKDLVQSGNDKRVIYAMISNFQNRINLLQQVIKKIEEIKNLKINRDETIL
jgi:septum formation inhibitor-activating ATPase MinD